MLVANWYGITYQWVVYRGHLLYQMLPFLAICPKTISSEGKLPHLYPAWSYFPDTRAKPKYVTMSALPSYGVCFWYLTVSFDSVSVVSALQAHAHTWLYFCMDKQQPKQDWIEASLKTKNVKQNKIKLQDYGSSGWGSRLNVWKKWTKHTQWMVIWTSAWWQ